LIKITADAAPDDMAPISERCLSASSSRFQPVPVERSLPDPAVLWRLDPTIASALQRTTSLSIPDVLGARVDLAPGEDWHVMISIDPRRSQGSIRRGSSPQVSPFNR
jgi:hypothetical protein